MNLKQNIRIHEISFSALAIGLNTSGDAPKTGAYINKSLHLERKNCLDVFPRTLSVPMREQFSESDV